MIEKNLGGAPEHVPTLLSRAKVEAFSCAGFSHEMIANYLRIDDKTLRKHYRSELDESKMDKIAGLSTNAYRMAMEGNEKMLEFVLKTQGKWAAAKPPEDDKPTKTDALLEKLIDKL